MADIFMNAKQVSAEFFNGEINYQKVLRMTRTGKLPGAKFGKSYLYLRNELEKWAEKNFSTPAWTKIKN